jgi:hypothetical protein
VIVVPKPNQHDAEYRELVKLTEYGDIFAMDRPTMYQCMDIGEARLICPPMRRLPLAKQADVGEVLEDM